MNALLFSALLVALSLMTTPVLAEHKLYITDVLAVGQSEVASDFAYGYSSGDYALYLLNFDPFTGARIADLEVPGTQRRNIFSSHYSLNVGIGHGLQVGAILPIIFIDDTKAHTDQFAFVPARKWQKDGVGDIGIGAKYNLYDDRTLKVVTGLDVKFFTADSNKAGTGTTDIAPFIAASTMVNHELKPFISYMAVFKDHGAADEHVITAGGDYEVNKSLTLTPKASVVVRTNSDWLSANNSYAIGLSSYINLVANLYVTSYCTVGQSSPTHSFNHTVSYGTLRFATAGIGLYYLFE